MNKSRSSNGIIYITSAYILWGFLPVYWRLIDTVPAGEILAHRVVWSFALMLGIVIFSSNTSAFIGELKMIIKDPKKLIGITVASIIISLNWLTYIWAVNNGHVVQASLGYYINPLISIILGVIVLKEKLTSRQILSFIIAGIGVVTLTFSFGAFPWISLILAVTFAIYGLLKKIVDVEAMFGLTLETMVITPIAVTYLFLIPGGAFMENALTSSTPMLLFGTGVATAIPLLLFAYGAKEVPLAMLGFLQYIAPTIMLILGVFIFKETFSVTHFISFTLIWVALIMYIGSMWRPKQTRGQK